MGKLSEFKQYDSVRIVEIKDLAGFSKGDINTREPLVGDVAAIVEIYGNPEGYELECVDSDTGATIWLHAFSADALEVEAFAT